MTRAAYAPLLLLTIAFLLTANARTPAADARQAKPGSQSGADLWLARTAKVKFNLVKSAALPFEFEIPKKDWMMVGGPGPGAEMQIVATSKNGEGTILVERTIMRQALDPSDITDLFMELEADTLKKRQPTGSQLESRIIEGGGRRIVAIEFTRAGLAGAERARQYSFPIGESLYRLTCAAPAGAFDKFAPVCAHIAASFAARE